MWELIAYNKRQSYMLIGALALLLMLLGTLIGTVLVPPTEGVVSPGSLIGVLVAFVIWLVMTTAAWYAGDRFVLGVSSAKRIEHKDYPQLFNVVEEMAIASGMPMPKVFIIDDTAPNAFATGRTPETASIAVTTGLADKLNRDELQGVVAHEMGHIRNRDILFMTLAGVLVGTIVLLCDFFLRYMWFFGGSGRRGSSRRSGGKQNPAMIVIVILTIVLAILAPFFARLLYMAISRRREYLADATAVELTRYPPGLASALEKISGDVEVLEVANRATAHLYIVNPIKPFEERYRRFTSTHPPIKERVSILRSIATGGSVGDYERTRRSLGLGPKSALVSPRTVSEAKPVELKKTGTFFPMGGKPGTPGKPGPKVMTPELLFDKLGPLGPMMMAGFLSCACGESVLIPADPKSMMLQCVACGKMHDLKAEYSRAQREAEAGAAAQVPSTRPKTLDDLDAETSGEGYDLERAAKAAEEYSRPGGPGTAGVDYTGKADTSRVRPSGSTAHAETPRTRSYDPTGDGGLAVRLEDEEDGAPDAKPAVPKEQPGDDNEFGITFDADGAAVFPATLTCPHCGGELPVPKGFKGSRGPCPKCRKMIVFFER